MALTARLAIGITLTSAMAAQLAVGGFGNMKPITASLILLISLLSYGELALADTKEKVLRSTHVIDQNYGRLRIDVIDVEEPVYQPFRMSVSVKCEPKAGEEESTTEWETLIDKDPICEYRPHDYDTKTKTLELKFSTSKLAPGEAQCNAHWKQKFNFKVICPR